VRGRETALGNMLADVIRNNTGTQIAFVNGGSIRINDDIPPGPITNYDLEGIVYYDNDLVSFELTGADIMEILTNSILRADSGDGRFLQISGMRFHYKQDGDRFVVTEAWVGDQPVDAATKYTASTLSFVYEKGIQDGYQIFTDGRRPAEIKPRVKSLKTLTRNYIRTASPVSNDVEKRIVRDDGSAAALPTCP
jgi:5'-nucleotidase